MWCTHTMEYDSTLESKEILTHATIWWNIEDTMLSKICQSQKDKYCIIVHLSGTQSRQIHKDRKQKGDCQGLRGVDFSFNKIIYFIYLFLAALGLRCCARAFSSCREQGLLFIAVRRLLIAVASLVVEHGLQTRGFQQLWHAGSVVVARGLQSTGSVVVAHGLSCSAACGIFPDQGWNPCPLHWQVDS